VCYGQNYFRFGNNYTYNGLPPSSYDPYEALNDRVTRDLWTTYKTAHAHECDFEEVDAAVMHL
jgi:hypothetical protein